MKGAVDKLGDDVGVLIVFVCGSGGEDWRIDQDCHLDGPSFLVHIRGRMRQMSQLRQAGFGSGLFR